MFTWEARYHFFDALLIVASYDASGVGRGDVAEFSPVLLGLFCYELLCGGRIASPSSAALAKTAYEACVCCTCLCCVRCSLLS
jgi:hypothetical protein